MLCLADMGVVLAAVERFPIHCRSRSGGFKLAIYHLFQKKAVLMLLHSQPHSLTRITCSMSHDHTTAAGYTGIVCEAHLTYVSAVLGK